MSADTVVVSQPDLEAFVVANVESTGVTCRAMGATADWPLWQRRYVIQVDARHRGGPGLARDRAEAAYLAICSLPDVDWSEGVITYVQPVTVPMPLPDNDGCPRYTAQYEIRCHPRPITAAPLGATP